jgi:hypothetical protein
MGLSAPAEKQMASLEKMMLQLTGIDITTCPFLILLPIKTKNDNLLLLHCGTMDKTLIRYPN